MSGAPASPRLWERTFTYSPVGLLLVDDFTSRAPIGRVSAELQELDRSVTGPKAPAWVSTGVAAVVTGGGVLAYPGLGLSTRPTEAPTRRCRVVISAQFYRPHYPPGTGGFEFDVPPFNHANPPAGPPVALTKAILLPTSNYPFPSEVPVVFGRVVGPDDAPVAGATVSYKNLQSALTDDRGEFALPLGRAKPQVGFHLDAHDPKGRLGSSGPLKLNSDPIPGLTITVS